MRVPLNMPKLGFDMEVGKIATWFKQVGDVVRRGEVIADIETDKATVEMEATAGGRLIEILQQAGAQVKVGQPIAILDDDA